MKNLSTVEIHTVNRLRNERHLHDEHIHALATVADRFCGPHHTDPA